MTALDRRSTVMRSRRLLRLSALTSLVCVAVACAESSEHPALPVGDATDGEVTYALSARADIPRAKGSSAALSPPTGVEPVSDAVRARIQKVEQGLRASYRDSRRSAMRLQDRMDRYNVPGVSIAVVNDYKVEWAKGYGVLSALGQEPVTPETLFQAASVGKPIVAAAALHEVDRGELDLDQDVNDYLSSWRVPENRLTTQEKVTLRRLLSHSAGVTVSGFRGYARGEPTPSLRQILDGDPPANSLPIRVDVVPGSQHRYSGGGYTIVQQLLEDVTGMAFADSMEAVVLDPWGMTSSTFESSLPTRSLARAASGHRSDGSAIPGGWHTYPEMGSGASLWSTPSDLARCAIGVMRAATGSPDGVISQRMASEMLSAQIGDRGLGPVLGDDGGDRHYFLHPGANEGYRSLLIAYPQRGQALVVMTNGDGGEELRWEIVRSVSTEYGWVQDRTYTYAALSAAIVAGAVAYWYLR